MGDIGDQGPRSDVGPSNRRAQDAEDAVEQLQIAAEQLRARRVQPDVAAARAAIAAAIAVAARRQEGVNGRLFTGCYEGVDKEEMEGEIRKYFELKKGVLESDEAWLSERLKESGMEDLMDNVKEVEDIVSYVILYKSLLSPEDTDRMNAFQEFCTSLRNNANDETKLMNKVISLVNGINGDLEEFKNLRRLTANITEKHRQDVIGTSTFEFFFDEIAQFDSMMIGIPPPTESNEILAEYKESLTNCLLRRLDMEMKMPRDYGLAYRMWIYEVKHLALGLQLSVPYLTTDSDDDE